MKKLLILAALLAVPAASAQAQSVQQVFQDFGLIGIWANACDQAANLDLGNSRAIYALSKTDGVILTYENGPRYKPSVYSILTARRTGKDTITYVQERLADQVRVTITLKKTPTGVSVWSSVMESGQVLVQDGRYTGSGRQNPLQVRCGA